MWTPTNNYSVAITAKEGANFQASSGAISPGPNVAISSLPVDQLDARVKVPIAVRKAGLAPVPHLAARLDWLKRIRDAGILAPVKIGIAGPTSIKSLLRFATLCGVNTSAEVTAKYGFSLSSLLGQASPRALLTDLEDKFQSSVHGEARLHFYPFGGVSKTVDWVQAFRQKRLPVRNFAAGASRSEAA